MLRGPLSTRKKSSRSVLKWSISPSQGEWSRHSHCLRLRPRAEEARKVRNSSMRHWVSEAVHLVGVNRSSKIYSCRGIQVVGKFSDSNSLHTRCHLTSATSRQTVEQTALQLQTILTTYRIDPILFTSETSSKIPSAALAVQTGGITLYQTPAKHS